MNETDRAVAEWMAQLTANINPNPAADDIAREKAARLINAVNALREFEEENQ